MHVHMLLRKNGQPVFYDPDGYGQLSRTAMHFIGGLLKHARSLCAIHEPQHGIPTSASSPGFEAPVTIGYAMANRSAVVRIPAYVKSPDKKRFELRNPDAMCNPYFAYAAILMAGLDGIERKIDPAGRGWGPFDFNLFDLPADERKRLGHLPASLDEALMRWKRITTISRATACSRCRCSRRSSKRSAPTRRRSAASRTQRSSTAISISDGPYWPRIPSGVRGSACKAQKYDAGGAKRCSGRDDPQFDFLEEAKMKNGTIGQTDPAANIGRRLFALHSAACILRGLIR